MHLLPKYMFLLSLKQDHFSNYTMIYLGSTPPFLYLYKCDISSQIQEKRSSHTPAVAPFKSRYALTSTKHVCTEPKARPF